MCVLGQSVVEQEAEWQAAASESFLAIYVADEHGFHRL